MVEFEENPYFHNLLPIDHFKKLDERFELPRIKGGRDPNGHSYFPAFILIPSYDNNNFIIPTFEGLETTSRYIISRLSADTSMMKNLTQFQRLAFLTDAVYIDYWSMYINPFYNGLDLIEELYAMGLARIPSDIPDRQILTTEQSLMWVKLCGGKRDKRDGMVVVPYLYFERFKDPSSAKVFMNNVKEMYPDTYNKQMYKINDIYSAKFENGYLGSPYPVFTENKFLY